MYFSKLLKGINEKKSNIPNAVAGAAFAPVRAIGRFGKKLVTNPKGAIEDTLHGAATTVKKTVESPFRIGKGVHTMATSKGDIMKKLDGLSDIGGGLSDFGSGATAYATGGASLAPIPITPDSLGKSMAAGAKSGLTRTALDKVVYRKSPITRGARSKEKLPPNAFTHGAVSSPRTPTFKEFYNKR